MKVGPIVSAAHLATNKPELSELEFALTMGHNAFQRWMVNCTAAAGEPGLSAMEVHVLHLLRHLDRPKTIAQLCLLLNVEDTHLVTYACRKLRDRGLASDSRVGKEKALATTARGSDLCDSYAQIRQQLLLETIEAMGYTASEITRLAGLLRALSGTYDQATRAAATI